MKFAADTLLNHRVGKGHRKTADDLFDNKPSQD